VQALVVLLLRLSKVSISSRKFSDFVQGNPILTRIMAII